MNSPTNNAEQRLEPGITSIEGQAIAMEQGRLGREQQIGLSDVSGHTRRAMKKTLQSQ